MNKRLGAGLLAAASTASVLGLTTGTASAAPRPCGTYPPGLGYSLVRAPYSGKVKLGSIVNSRGTLRRGGQACVGFPLGLYNKPAKQVGYRLVASRITDSTGSVRIPFKITGVTRIYYNLNLGGGKNVHSGISEFTIRR